MIERRRFLAGGLAAVGLAGVATVWRGGPPQVVAATRRAGRMLPAAAGTSELVVDGSFEAGPPGPTAPGWVFTVAPT